MSAPPPSDGPFWVAFGLILGLFFGTAAGVLGWLGGQPPPLAILTGAAAFGGTVTLVLLIRRGLGF